MIAEGSRARRQTGAPASGTGNWILAIAGAIVALLLQLGFAASYVGALHDPAPHDLPVGLVAPPSVAAGLARQAGAQSGSAFHLIGEPDVASVRHAIDQRSIYGGLVFSARGLQAIVADAAGPSAAQAVTTFGQGIAAARQTPLTVQHVHPLGSGDPRGLTAFYLVVAWVFGGYFCATVLSTVRGTTYRGRAHAALRLLLLAGYAILSGILGMVIAESWIGAISGHFVVLAAAGTLVVFAVATATMALQLILGLAGTLVALVAFVLLGNPSSGGVFPNEFLPPFWHAVGPWLPNAAGVTLIQNVLYFGGTAVGRALLVLAGYAVIGSLLLIALATHRRPRSPFGEDIEAELATAAAAGV